MPDRTLGARGAEGPPTDRDNLTAHLQFGDEEFGTEYSALGMAPSNEHLDAGEGVGLQIDRRLVDQEEFARLERAREVTF